MVYARNILIAFVVLLVVLGIAVVATGNNDAGESENEGNAGNEAAYRVVTEESQGGECETLYLDVVMTSDSAENVENLVDDYDGETDAVQATIWSRETDIESQDEFPVGNLRASYSDCGEAATGLPSGEYEYGEN